MIDSLEAAGCVSNIEQVLLYPLIFQNQCIFLPNLAVQSFNFCNILKVTN